MIVVRLSSGIGNQLFQYAFAVYLKDYYGEAVYLEKSSFKYRTAQRRCSIDIISELPVVSDWRIYNNYRNPICKLSKALFTINPFVRSITDSNLTYPLNNKLLYFDGFWQTDFFITQVTNFKNYFQPKETMPAFLTAYLDDIRHSDSISMHVRRGDYFSDEFRDRYGVCNEAYYQKALDLMLETAENRKVFVFSDDLDWVKNHLNLPDNTVFVRNEEVYPYWYIYLMSFCKDHIISNSSFSWWGAFLNENEQKQVIAPKTWMVGQEGTIALESWIKI